MTGRAKVAVLISGRGSNMSALIEAAKAADCPYEVVLVVSNRADAEGLALAEAAGVPTLAVPSKDFGADREAHERAIDAALRAAGVDAFVAAYRTSEPADYTARFFAARLRAGVEHGE